MSGELGGGLGRELGIELGLQHPCSDLLAGAHDVLRVAFQLDVQDGVRQPVRTTEAVIYLRTRMGLVTQFERVLWQAVGGNSGGLPLQKDSAEF